MYPPPQSPIFMEERMSFDEVAWDQCDAVFAAWKKRLFNEDIFREIGALIIKHRGALQMNSFPHKRARSTSYSAWNSSTVVRRLSDSQLLVFSVSRREG